MHPDQMAERAPHSPMSGTGWLRGWRLTFGGGDIGWEGSLATVTEDRDDPDARVFVVLYDVTTEDEDLLDRWEGSELGIHRKIRARVDTGRHGEEVGVVHPRQRAEGEVGRADRLLDGDHPELLYGSV